MPAPNPMTVELERQLYYQGIGLFNGHDFFEAHEAWEEIWHMAFGLKHTFYQAMIQCAVALEHYRRSNPRGVISLHRSFGPRFMQLPPIFMGLDVALFTAQMEGTLRPVLHAVPPPQRGQIALDLSSAPQIALKYDPFETGEAQSYRQAAEF